MKIKISDVVLPGISQSSARRYLMANHNLDVDFKKGYFGGVGFVDHLKSVGTENMAVRFYGKTKEQPDLIMEISLGCPEEGEMCDRIVPTTEKLRGIVGMLIENAER